MENKKLEGKKIVSGLIILVIAVFCGTYTQIGIDGRGDMSILGFILMWVVGISVAYVLEKVTRHYLFEK